MGLPDNLHDAICNELEVLPHRTLIRFPGGVGLEVIGESLRAAPKLLLGKLNTALTPLIPLFNIIDALLAVAQVFEAVKSLNPLTIALELVKLVKKLDKLLALIPQVSVPLMIVDTIDALIDFLVVFRGELAALVATKLGIDVSAARGAELGGVGGLDIALGCAQSNLDAAFLELKTGAAPVNRLVGVLNLVGGIVGLPEVPALDDLGPDASAALVPVDALIEALRQVRGAIPV